MVHIRAVIPYDENKVHIFYAEVFDPRQTMKTQLFGIYNLPVLIKGFSVYLLHGAGDP